MVHCAQDVRPSTEHQKINRPLAVFLCLLFGSVFVVMLWASAHDIMSLATQRQLVRFSDLFTLRDRRVLFLLVQTGKTF